MCAVCRHRQEWKGYNSLQPPNHFLASLYPVITTRAGKIASVTLGVGLGMIAVHQFYRQNWLIADILSAFILLSWFLLSYVRVRQIEGIRPQFTRRFRR